MLIVENKKVKVSVIIAFLMSLLPIATIALAFNFILEASSSIVSNKNPALVNGFVLVGFMQIILIPAIIVSGITWLISFVMTISHLKNIKENSRQKLIVHTTVVILCLELALAGYVFFINFVI